MGEKGYYGILSSPRGSGEIIDNVTLSAKESVQLTLKAGQYLDLASASYHK